jgi:hypothetical protein
MGGQTIADGVQIQKEDSLTCLLDQAASQIDGKRGFADLLFTAVYRKNNAHPLKFVLRFLSPFLTVR